MNNGNGSISSGELRQALKEFEARAIGLDVRFQFDHLVVRQQISCLDEQMVNDEQVEEEDDCMVISSPIANNNTVEYHIFHSVGYQTPVVYFRIVNRPLDLDAVYKHLVPNAERDHLATSGILGGISMANHPETDTPWLFVHPCRTQEAMRPLVAQQGAQLTPLRYLVLWMGLVGRGVGLALPMSLARDL